MSILKYSKNSNLSKMGNVVNTAHNTRNSVRGKRNRYQPIPHPNHTLVRMSWDLGVSCDF